MHTMQESENAITPLDDAPPNGYLEGSHRDLHRPQREGRSLRLVLAAVGGMLVPLVTQIGHAH